MSLFRDMAATVHAAHEEYFADTVSVQTPGQEEPEETPAVLYRVEIVDRASNGSVDRIATRRCRFTQLATIRHDALVLIGQEEDQETWTIDSVGERTASGLKVVLRRVQRHKTSRPGYRTQS
jgi:hypothetical protein